MRLPRFADYRYVGVRPTMKVYDTDDPAHSEQLEREIAAGDLERRNLLQTFAPDSLAEAANRGFAPR
jgi:hypothetical protein